MNTRILIIVLSFCIQLPQALAQEDLGKNTRPAYLKISSGISRSSFRDFATSPLIYSGQPVYLGLAHLDFDSNRTSLFSLTYSFGSYTNEFNHHESISSVKTLSMNYLELFQLKSIQSEKWNLKVGGRLNATANHRENELLQNNGEGVDIVGTLFGSVSVTRYIKRKERQNDQLSLTFHTGLINSSYRNGYAYVNQSALLNSDEFFDDYQLEIFSGFRLASAIDYTFFLKNYNAVQVSYLWDAYHTGREEGEFEMATHTLACSILFNLKQSK